MVGKVIGFELHWHLQAHQIAVDHILNWKMNEIADKIYVHASVAWCKHANIYY